MLCMDVFVEAGVAERTQNGENQKEGDVCDCGVLGHLCNLS